MPLDFPAAPIPGDVFVLPDGSEVVYDGEKWTPPGTAYLPIAGGTMLGPILLEPPYPLNQYEAGHKQYIDEMIAAQSLYQGLWQVAANTPDLDPAVALPLAGFSWLAQTVDQNIPELAPANLPGIGGQPINAGDSVRWNAQAAIYSNMLSQKNNMAWRGAGRGETRMPRVATDEEYLGTSVKAAGFRSRLGVPLLRGGRSIGAIVIFRTEPGHFADKHIELLKTFADQAVIAIENVRLFTELEARTAELTRSVGELKALGEVGHAVSSTLDLETVLSTIVSRATQLARMDGGAIHEYDEARGEFHLRTTSNLPDELVAALQAAPVAKGEGAVGRMAATREPAQFNDIAETGSYDSRIRESLVRYGYRSVSLCRYCARITCSAASSSSGDSRRV